MDKGGGAAGGSEGSGGDGPAKTSFGFSFNKRSVDEKKIAVQEKKEVHQEDLVVSISGSNIERCNGSVLIPPLMRLSLTAQPKKGPLVIAMPDNRAKYVEKKYLDLLKKQIGKGDATPAMEIDKAVEREVPKEGEAEAPSLEEQAIAELQNESKEGEMVEVDDGLELPLLLKYRNTNLDEIADEQQRFLADVQSRPDEASLDEYNQIPVGSFGTALLRGMGWAPGGAIGLTNPKAVQPIEYVARPGYRTGLGATPKTEPKKPKKWIKPGESRDDDEPMVLAPRADGTSRHVKGLDEKLVKKSSLGIQEGSLVGIVAGRHDGLYARVMKLRNGIGEAVVRLEASSEEVTVSKSDLTLVNEKKLGEMDPALAFQDKYGSNGNTGNRRSTGSSGSSRDSGSKRRSTKEEDRSYKKEKRTEPVEKGWLYPNTLVRIISKSFSGGNYYLKKGKVYDVLSSSECTVQLSDSGKLIDVKQRMLETIVPKVGESVMIVSGEHAGQLGKIMEKGKEDATVQLLGDFSVETFQFDSICQYVEDRSH